MGEISSALEQRSSGPEALIEQYRADLAEAMPAHVRPGIWLRAAQNALRTNETLRKVAASNPASLMNALAAAAELGHQPGSDHYYLVPLRGEVLGIEGYKGMIDRMYRSQRVASVHAHVVHEKDRYSYKPGPGAVPDHEPWDGDDPGEMVRVYAYAVMTSGAVSQVAVLTRQQVEGEHRAHAKGWDNPKSPWQTQTRRMWLKCAVKELSAWVPLSNEWRDGVMPAVSDEGSGVVDAEIVD